MKPTLTRRNRPHILCRTLTRPNPIKLDDLAVAGVAAGDLEVGFKYDKLPAPSRTRPRIGRCVGWGNNLSGGNRSLSSDGDLTTRLSGVQ